MKYISLILLSALLLLASCTQKTERFSFNDDWKFKLLNEKVHDHAFSQIEYDDEDWEEVKLPHTAHLEPMVVNDQWQGVCWYRKNFFISKDFEDKKLIFEFEAAMNYSNFWINGEQIAVHQGGYLPVVFDASKYIKFGEDNVIAVRLNNEDNTVTGPKPLKRLDFNMYGGLYRNAWVYVEEKVHITHPILANETASGGTFIAYPQVSAEQSQVKVQTQVRNDECDAQEVVIEYKIWDGERLVSEQSKKVHIDEHSAANIHTLFTLDNAKLWSPDAPNLYQLETKVLLHNRVVDKDLTRFGIREFVFKGQDLYLNGKKIFLRGVNRHQEYPFVGYAASDNAQYRDAQKIKDGGFDYVRLSHYPQSPAFMDACDELGLVVIDAILGWQYFNDTESFKNYCYKSARNLIRRDRNHPCVLAWEVSLNETAMPIYFMEELHRIVHEEYPENYAYSCGWKNDVYDLFLQARQHRLLHPKDTLIKPYNVSEYGDWEYFSNNAALFQDSIAGTKRVELSSRQLRANGEERLLNQAHNVQEAHNDNFRTPAFADGYWVMFDYNRGYHDDLESSGLMDVFRLPKFAYYFYQSQRAADVTPMVKIASYWNEKSPLSLKVFSNADRVVLSLNGEVIADQIPDEDDNSDLLQHPPFTFDMKTFEAGKLVAEAYIGGQKVAEDIVMTPQEPVDLKVWIDESKVPAQAGCNDVLFVYIAAVDKNGTVVPDYDKIVDVELDGDVELMNVGDVKAEAGIATVLVRIGDKGGKIKLKAVSDDLKGSFAKSIK